MHNKFNFENIVRDFILFLCVCVFYLSQCTVNTKKMHESKCQTFFLLKIENDFEQMYVFSCLELLRFIQIAVKYETGNSYSLFYALGMLVG